MFQDSCSPSSPVRTNDLFFNHKRTPSSRDSRLPSFPPLPHPLNFIFFHSCFFSNFLSTSVIESLHLYLAYSPLVFSPSPCPHYPQCPLFLQVSYLAPQYCCWCPPPSFPFFPLLFILLCPRPFCVPGPPRALIVYTKNIHRHWNTTAIG